MPANRMTPKLRRRTTMLLFAALLAPFAWGCADDTTAPTAPAPTGTPPPEPTLPPNDRIVLIEFYNATDGPNWRDNTGWNTGAALGEWHGVHADSDNQVTSLDLSSNRLRGTIPASLGNLTGLTRLARISHSRA